MVQSILERIISRGGIPYAVGGWVRDRMVGKEPKDLDIEVHGLYPDQLVSTLKEFGEVDLVGEAFGVYLLRGLDVDWSIPRRDNLVGKGHKGFDVETDPFMGIEEAAKRRDFTINAMSIDMRDDSLVDPFGGKNDLEGKILRVINPDTFVEDPLRVLRGAQFCARLELSPDEGTVSLCRSIKGEYQYLAKERVREEWRKLLLKGTKPSMGLEFLRATEWLEHFPELQAMVGCPQDPRHHPEGGVFTHTCQVVDTAVGYREDVPEEDRWAYMLACLLHDVGKPLTTVHEDDGGISSRGHDQAGVEPAESFLLRFTSEENVIKLVKSLVKNHMAPHQFDPGFSGNAASDAAFRRLAKKVDLHLIGLVAKADGGTDWFLEKAKDVKVTPKKQTIVMGRHLIARGLKPGPQFGEIIRECEEIFLEEGIDDPNELLDRVLS